MSEGEELAKAWLAGESELIDDLSVLVDGMDRPLDATARAFLLTIGTAAKASGKQARPTPSLPDKPKIKAPEVAPPLPVPPAFEGLGESGFAQRFAELSAKNAAAWR
jgi:hypothetical protein